MRSGKSEVRKAQADTGLSKIPASGIQHLVRPNGANLKEAMSVLEMLKEQIEVAG